MRSVNNNLRILTALRQQDHINLVVTKTFIDDKHDIPPNSLGNKHCLIDQSE